MSDDEVQSKSKASKSIEKGNDDIEVVVFDEDDDGNDLEDVTDILEDVDPDLYKRKDNDDDIDEEMKVKRSNLEIDACCGNDNKEDSNTDRECFPKLGEIRVLCPSIYHRTKMGVIGPNWFGPIFTLALLLGASQYYIRKSMEIGTVSTVISVMFTVSSVVSLYFTACTDPGVVRGGMHDHLQQSSYENIPTQDDDKDLSEWRYCDLCGVNQPPNAVHCPECNACIIGFDHHCVWMGICIGKNNFTAFVIFNLSWFLYLMYGGLWVSLFSQVILHKHESNT